MEDVDLSFGSALHRYRLRIGLTQEELAERAGISREAVSALERGTRRTPWPATVRRLTEALDLTELERSRLIWAARIDVSTRAENVVTLSVIRTSASRPNNLPSPVSPFVGRHQELEAIAALLRLSDARLVTLTGPGGIGKTRLALAVATELLASFADGVFLVSLAPLRDPTLVPSAVARALGVAEIVGQSLEDTLATSLRDRHMLLLLDNFEHVLEAAPLATHLLESCPRLAILATSRTVLRLSGEHSYSVPTLAVPLGLTDSDPAVTMQYDSVKLFVERTWAANQDFTLTEASGRAVAAICTRLDGLPLAIELAAARMRTLTPQALLGRLDHRLQLLTGGARDLPARQQTLRDTIDWSFQLLRADEAAVFASLSVFAGGWTMPAAHVICAPDLFPHEVERLLSSLTDQSLIQS